MISPRTVVPPTSPICSNCAPSRPTRSRGSVRRGRRTA